MPRHAMQKVAVDFCLPMDEMSSLVARLSRQRAGPPVPIPEEIELEAHIAEQEMIAMIEEHSGNSMSGKPSMLTCPDCGGSLMEVQDGPLLRFRCHVGHAYSPAALVEAQGEAFEQALWMALRTHNERIKLFTRMKESAEAQDKPHTAAKWSEAMNEAQGHVDLLRAILMKHTPSSGEASLPD
jgi:two-component system chemotaxis response regulator CheB